MESGALKVCIYKIPICLLYEVESTPHLKTVCSLGCCSKIFVRKILFIYLWLAN